MKARWIRAVGLVMCVALVAACSSPEEKKVIFFNKGVALLEEGDLVKARLELKNAIQIDQKFAQAYYYLAKVELKENEYKLAYGYFHKAVDLDNDLLAAHVEIGRLLLMARQVEKAREKYEFVLGKQPGHVEGRLLEANVLIAGKKPKAARERLSQLRAEGVTHFEMYLSLARIETESGDSVNAIKVLNDGISVNSNNIRLRAMLSAILAREKHFDKAAAVIKKIIELKPEKKAHKVKLASLYWEAGLENGAVSVFEDMISSDAEPSVIRIMAADFYAKRNKIEKAIEVIKAGIATDEKNIKLRLVLARLQLVLRQHDKALETLMSAIPLTEDEADSDLLKVKNQLARVYLVKGDVSLAKQYIDEVIAVSGSNVDAQFTAGQMYLKQKESLDAVSAFRTVVAEKPDAIKAYLQLTNAHLMNKERQLAKDALTNGIEANPTADVLRKALARIYVAEKNFDRAERELRLIVEQQPENTRACGDLADFLFQRQRPDEAIGIYEKMVAEQPRIPAGYLKLAAIYRMQKNQTAARSILEKGYAAIPQSHLILTHLVKSYLVAGELDKSESLVQERVTVNDKDVAAHNLLGEICLAGKQYTKAQQAFDKAISIAPEWQTPHNNLARLFLSQGKREEAIGKLKAALEKNPQNPAAYMTLGQLYLTDGLEEKAMRIFEEALVAMPNMWPAANNLAYMLCAGSSDKGDLDRAHKLALKAVRLQPERPDVIDTLGWVHYLRGENEMAIKELEKAVEKAPDSAIINYHMGMALIKANRLDEAREMLEKAIIQENFSERDSAEKALKRLLAS